MCQFKKNTNLVESERLGEREAPSLLEGAADHGAARGGRGACQAERVGEFEAADVHGDVHLVHWREKTRQGRALRYRHIVQGLSTVAPTCQCKSLNFLSSKGVLSKRSTPTI